MSFITHPELLRRRRIWQEREPVGGGKIKEEIERKRKERIKDSIVQREREHQIHLKQFPIDKDDENKVYSNQESQIVLVFSILVILTLFLLFPWTSPLRTQLMTSFYPHYGIRTQSNSLRNVRSSRQPPLPQPAPFPNPRRLDVKPLFIKKRPKTIPPQAIALPGIKKDKNKDHQNSFGSNGAREGKDDVRPTKSSSAASADAEPQPPTPTKGSQDWQGTLGKRVSNRKMKGKGKKYQSYAYNRIR